MNFGEKLKLVRCTLGLSQEEFANRLDTTKQAISRYENSEREPNLRTAKSISDKLGIDLTVLADDDLYIPVPDKIRSERIRRGLGIAQLASMLRISEDRLSAFENGELFPSALELASLSKVFSSSADWFLGLGFQPEAPAFTGFETHSLTNNELSRLSTAMSQMNEEGRERVVEYAEDLAAGGRYKKPGADSLGKEA